ncbi:isoprenylcysteine carboxyl methyltransferase (ICMT) family protein [Novosphingobium kunmingense]|uniref:Isoprenylcysteine carboxyl methyltransferase (ICMT) family protein n=1 Tax=Novosphingobium kunmingense TaxID=1211806 RepID=A0A2N0I438_9SPHN|nr:isoprenylcysteine carboxylmethyltransferase family protein [Novosphingobium kunmingense]PKB25951.1 isoprenylcysteine carboxyl methyltransferase (ICMT) family protein [Novosphingobium kunmingense]
MTTRPAPSGPRPSSDVSAAIGLTGVAGLAVWVCVCHFWPEIADALNAPGPRARLVGPYAALLGLVITALPMVLWSVLIDKVHLRPSTGIDWSLRRPIAAIFDISVTKLAGLWATWALIAALYCLCRWYWSSPYLIAMEVLSALALPLFVLSIPYVFWLDRRLVESRDACWHFGAVLIGREAADRSQVWIHLRAWAVKGFFTAFMISIVPGGFTNLVAPDWSVMAASPAGLAAILVTLMFVLDEQVGTVGYVLTMKPLDAQIRSANPYVAGWLAALLCYPPFQIMGAGRPIFYTAGTDGDDNWARVLGGFEALQWGWAGLLVVLTAIYAWATVAFGIRFSNLTYRGVLTNGPYAFTRHPAYLSKNLFWWCAVLPMFVTTGSFTDMVRNTFFLGVVSAIYFWRARTEEKHLLAEDPKYVAYWHWMEANGLITAPLARLGRALNARRPGVQSASAAPSS